MKRHDDPVRIVIASPPDREKLVAELFVGNEQWGEGNQEGENLSVEVYPRQDGQPWRLGYDEVVTALSEAKRRLRR